MKTLKFSGILLFLFVCVFVGTPANAVTIYVDDSNVSGTEDGSRRYPYNTLQEAVNTRTEGDVIRVMDGTYTENVTVTPITTGTAIGIRVEGVGTVTVTPVDVYSPIIDISGAITGSVIDVSNITIEMHDEAGVRFSSGEGIVRIHDCNFTEDPAAGGFDVISITNSFNDSSSRFQFYHNRIDVPLTYYGIYINESGNTTNTTIMIRNNLFLSCTGGAAISSLDSKVSIRNNTFDDCYFAFFCFESDVTKLTSIFSDNIVNLPGSGYGIYGSGSPVVNVRYNDIYTGTTGNGITGLATSSIIRNNINADPIFSDSDMHLDPSSPCYDAGTPRLKDDDGTRIDMGAYGGMDPMLP